MDNVELEKLRRQHPDWSFSVRWIAAASAGDKCLFEARLDGVRLGAWTVSDLGSQVAQAEREMGR